MGGILSSRISENIEKNYEKMQNMQQVSFERQIQLQNQMRERMLALQIAKTRELLNWIGPFYIIAASGMIRHYQKTKKPSVLAPLLPLTFVVGYQADMAYGNKVVRIKAEAENILLFERNLLGPPGGLPTTSSIDQAREAREEEARLHASNPPLYY